MITGDSQEEVIIFRDTQTAPIIYRSSSAPPEKMNKQRVVSRLQLLDHRVVERILVKEIILEYEQNVFLILKIFDVDLIPPFEKHFKTRGLKKLKRWMILHCINILTSLKRASFLFSLWKSTDKLNANMYILISMHCNSCVFFAHFLINILIHGL